MLPNVLIFKEDLLPISETFIQAQAEALTRFRPIYVGLGTTKISLPVPQDSLLLTRGHSYLGLFRRKLYSRLSIAPAFHRKLKSLQPCLVHAHFANGGKLALRLSGHVRAPLLVHLHGYDVTARTDFRARYAALWRRASLYICVSKFIHEKAVSAGFPEDRLLVHYTGIDRSLFKPSPLTAREATVLFVGRLVEKKGCEHLINGHARLQQRRPGAKLVIVGDGPLRGSLQSLANKLGVNCIFLGGQPASVVIEWMSRARVFCVPSVTARNGDSEGLANVFGEAQASGLPVVSTNHGGIPEIVRDGITGFLGPESDPAFLSEHIGRLMDDDILWQSFSEQGSEWIASKFDLHAQTKKLEEIFLRLIRDFWQPGLNGGIKSVLSPLVL